MFFPNPLPETIFRGSKCPSMLTNTILDRFLIFLGSQNRPLNRQIWPENHKKGIRPNGPSYSGTDLSAIRRWQRSTVVFSSFWDRFLTLFNRFYIIFNLFFQICSIHLLVVLGKIWDEFCKSFKRILHILVMISIRISRFKFLILFSQNANPHIPYSISSKHVANFVMDI